jgi:hypothetical protein
MFNEECAVECAVETGPTSEKPFRQETGNLRAISIGHLIGSTNVPENRRMIVVVNMVFSFAVSRVNGGMKYQEVNHCY